MKIRDCVKNMPEKEKASHSMLCSSECSCNEEATVRNDTIDQIANLDVNVLDLVEFDEGELVNVISNYLRCCGIIPSLLTPLKIDVLVKAITNKSLILKEKRI